MAVIRSVSRAAVAGAFVASGWDAFLDPGHRTTKAAAIGVPQPELATVLNGGAMVVAGVALGMGVAPRLTAAVLAALLVPTTLAGHPFWKESEPGPRSQQRTQFLKNLCMLGGLVEIAAAPRPRRRREGE
ncbi:MAG: DoxX family protein [Actinomycetota bacterium]|nr:DoxX family protein [Actinomycetota bacterium]